MRFNFVFTLIALVISSLLGYWVYSVADTDVHATLAGIFSTICFAFPLIIGTGISFNTSASQVNIKALSWVLFILMLIMHFYYASNGVTMPYYVLINGILICIYVAVVYGIIQSKQ